MAKLKLAVWCEAGRDTADFHRALADRWPDGIVSPGITRYSLVRPARSRNRTPSEHLA
jgi:hypothetical protein